MQELDAVCAFFDVDVAVAHVVQPAHPLAEVEKGHRIPPVLIVIFNITQGAVMVRINQRRERGRVRGGAGER